MRGRGSTHTDRERARQLLAEAGYGQGFITSLVVRRPRADETFSAGAIQRALKTIGVQVELVKVSSPPTADDESGGAIDHHRGSALGAPLPTPLASTHVTGYAVYPDLLPRYSFLRKRSQETANC